MFGERKDTIPGRLAPAMKSRPPMNWLVYCGFAFLGFLIVADADEPPIPLAADPGPPPAELVDYTCSPTFGETYTYLKTVAASCRHITLASFARSTEGYPIPVLFLYDRSGPGGAWDTDVVKPVVLITAGIHAGEICGNDALLRLLREIAAGHAPWIIENLRLIIIPIFNVSGHVRRSPYNRFTQNGPDCGFGTRRTSSGFDLNRDYAKLETAECRGLVRLASQFQPHIYIDLHTDDGFGHQYDMLFSPAVNPSYPGRRDAFVRNELVPHLEAEMDRSGFKSHWIGWPVESFDPSAGLAAYGINPRIGTGYFETRQAISILAEAYPYRPYPQRVLATEAFVRAILHFAATNRIRLCEIVDQARTEAIRWAREPGIHEIALGCSADLTRPTMITWLGKQLEIRTSEITGRHYPFYLEQDATYELPFYSEMAPRTTNTMPRGYLLGSEWSSVVKTLRRHSIPVHHLTQPFETEVEIFDLTHAEFAAMPYQGHHPLDDIRGSWHREARTFAPGTYWIPLDHPAGLTAMHLLEPESPDGLLTWNAFDTIFERGIIVEDWALEESARRLLEDPEMRQAYEAACSDTTLAADPDARLEFLFGQTPYREAREMRYPAFRVLGSAPEAIGP